MIEPDSPLESFSTPDPDREARQGFPEAIFAEFKTPSEVAKIAQSIYERAGRLLATRASEEQFQAVRVLLPSAIYSARAKTIHILPEASRIPSTFVKAHVTIVAAGTSDLTVAEEAGITLEVAGIGTVQRIYDVGVAGIERLFRRVEELRSTQVIIVCAGMEGALPSVVGGLVKVPVIAVPTSVGYGASFGGLAALLGMLNSCASGLTVVNIDNGFGAAMAAIRIFSALTNSSSDTR